MPAKYVGAGWVFNPSTGRFSKNGSIRASFRDAMADGLFRHVAQSRGLTQKAAAEELAPVSFMTIRNWWTGGNPQVLYRPALLDWMLGVDMPGRDMVR